MTEALLSFSLGPVQEFIAAARTTRDLWTGSWLLSWLTAHAMAAVTRDGGEIISPDVSGNPLFEAATGNSVDSDRVLSPCVPQTFLARIHGDPADARQQCEDAVRNEWKRISGRVRTHLGKSWGDDWPGWDERWDVQVDRYWDIRVLVLPADGPDLARLQKLCGLNGAQQASPDKFQLLREYLGRLAAADKAIRHYPPHEFDEAGKPDTRPKCSLLGSCAQMGPPRRIEDFWKGPRDADDQRDAPRRDWTQSAAAQASKDGIRLGRRDRLCAVSLVKRFAWAASIAPMFQRDSSTFLFPDVDTIGAGAWLAEARRRDLLDRDKARTENGRGYWSGHWLRWNDRLEGQQPDRDDIEECPDLSTWDAIRATRKKLGPPPVYFAVLMLDGDRMGDLFRDADESRLRTISGTLARFALKDVHSLDNVQSSVEETHHGKLVYAGGDDVLALLPTTTALACACDVRRLFTERMEEAGIRHSSGAPVTCSAGLVVAHARQNLRDVLHAVRTAEHQAKHDGRDRLALSVMKRSGEHTTVSCPWPQVEQLAALVQGFQQGASESNGDASRGERTEDLAADAIARTGESDRWAYQFRRELEEALPGVPGLLEAELKRLLNRADGVSAGFQEQVLKFRDDINRDDSPVNSNDIHGRASLDSARRFTTLVQSASFLARGGKDER